MPWIHHVPEWFFHFQAGVNIYSGRVVDGLRKAKLYLESNRNSQSGIYEQAILTLALAKLNSTYKNEANAKLRRMSCFDPGEYMISSNY